MTVTAPKAQQIKTVVWTPASGSALTIPGVQDVQGPGRSGSRLAWSGNGVATEQAQSMEDISGRCTVTTTDLSLQSHASLAIGTAGSLAVTNQQRAARGAVGGADQTATMPESMVESVEPGPPHRGLSTLTITFTGVKEDGTEPVTYGA